MHFENKNPSENKVIAILELDVTHQAIHSASMTYVIVFEGTTNINAILFIYQRNRMCIVHSLFCIFRLRWFMSIYDIPYSMHQIYQWRWFILILRNWKCVPTFTISHKHGSRGHFLCSIITFASCGTRCIAVLGTLNVLNILKLWIYLAVTNVVCQIQGFMQ